METILVTLLFCGICQVMTAPNATLKLEDYLYQYGYLPATDRENAVKRSARDLEQATMRLQKFMGLDVTGKLDGPTLELLTKPRCGMPDMVVRDDGVHGILEVNDGPSNYYLSSSKWTTFPVSYGLINRTPDLPASTVDTAMDEAVRAWTDVSGLSCKKTSYASVADVQISFGSGQHVSCPLPHDGPGRNAAHAWRPGTGMLGDVHFDDDEDWTYRTHSSYNLLSVAIHELGHALGINHSSDPNAIMYATVQPSSNPSLAPDDVAAIRALYGN